MPDGPRTSRLAAPARVLRRLAMPALAATLIASTAALPSAAAASPTPEVTTPAISAAVNVSPLSPQALQELLAGIRAGETGVPAGQLEVAKLAKLLAGLPGINELPSVSGLGGTSGVEAALREALAKLLAGHTTLGELLSAGVLSGEVVKALEQTTHLPVATLIETALKKSPEEVLTHGLGSLGLSELLAKLLSSSGNLTQLLDSLLEALNPATLQRLLGSLPSGAPLQSLTVGELAGSLSKTPEALAALLGQPAASLPASASAATRVLENGNRLALVDGAEGLAFAVLSKAGEAVGGAGGAGGAGPAGAGGAAGSGTTTLVTTTSAGAARGSAARTAAGKVRILSRKVKGSRVTLVVQVPGAGTLTLSGTGVNKVTRETAKAERVTITTALTKARAASLRKHHHKPTNVKLTAAFAPVSAAASKASTTVGVR